MAKTIICLKSNHYEDGQASVTEGREYEITEQYTDAKGTIHYVITDDQGFDNHFTADNGFFDFTAM